MTFQDIFDGLACLDVSVATEPGIFKPKLDLFWTLEPLKVLAVLTWDSCYLLTQKSRSKLNQPKVSDFLLDRSDSRI